MLLERLKLTIAAVRRPLVCQRCVKTVSRRSGAEVNPLYHSVNFPKQHFLNLRASAVRRGYGRQYRLHCYQPFDRLIVFARLIDISLQKRTQHISARQLSQRTAARGVLLTKSSWILAGGHGRLQPRIERPSSLAPV